MTLHSHISGAPFHGTQQMTRGVRVHIYQQRGCTVKHARLSLDIMATIAKAMQRFRIAAVTWCSGWVAVLLVRQLAEYHASGVIPALGVVVENTLQQNLAIVLAVIVFSPLVQGLLGLFVPNEQLFLGSSAWSLVWLYPIIALASFGLVLVVSKLLAAMVSLTSYILWRRPTPEPSSQCVGFLYLLLTFPGRLPQPRPRLAGSRAPPWLADSSSSSSSSFHGGWPSSCCTSSSSRLSPSQRATSR